MKKNNTLVFLFLMSYVSLKKKSLFYMEKCLYLCTMKNIDDILNKWFKRIIKATLIIVCLYIVFLLVTKIVNYVFFLDLLDNIL